MKTPIICCAVILLLSFACTQEKKVASEDLTVTSEPYSADASLPQAVTSALPPAQQDSIFVSEYVTEWYPAHKPNFAELKPLKQYVPSGYKLYNYFVKDLNGDGLTDCVMLVTPKEQTQEYESDIVLLYVREKDKTLKLHTRNEAIKTFPTQSLRLEADASAGGFTLSTHVAGMDRHAQVTNTTSHFTYSKKEKDWFLNCFCFFTETLGGRDLEGENGYPIRDEEGNFIEDTTGYEEEPLVLLDKGEACTTYLTAKDFGTIPFATFDLDEMESKQWEI